MTCVFFDGDGTLWDFQALMRRVLGETADLLRARRPKVAGDVSVDALVRDRDEAAREQVRRLPHEELRRLGFERTLARLGIPDDGLAAELAEFFLDRRFAGVELYDDTLGCLVALRERGHRVGLLSNGNSYPERSGLAAYFDAVVFAHDVGADKPDPRTYAAAERALPGERYVMVGDNATDDVAGPQRTGWKGVWLNRTGATLEPGVLPDAVVTTLADVPATVEELVGR